MHLFQRLGQRINQYVGMDELSAELEMSFQTPVPSREKVSPIDLWKEVFTALSRLLRQAVYLSLLVAFLSAASTLVAMQLLREDRSISLLVAIAIGYLVLNLASHLIWLRSGKQRFEVSLGAENYLTQRISEKILALSSQAMARQSTGNLKVLITSDVKTVGDFLDNLVRNFIPSVTALFVVIPFLLHFTGMAGIVGLLVMVTVLPISLGLNVFNTALYNKVQAQTDAITALMGEWVKHVRLVRYLSWGDVIRKEIREKMDQMLAVSSAQHFVTCLIFGMSITWWMVSITAVMSFARLSSVPIDLTGFFGSLWILTFLSSYLMHVPNTIRMLGESIPSMRRIATLLSEEERKSAFLGEGKKWNPDRLPRKLVFNQVGFRYADGTEVLKSVSFEIDLSRKTAIIGKVGSGKSTLLKLIAGELPPTSGEILVDIGGDPVSSVENLWRSHTFEQFRKEVAYVPQDPFISNDTIEGNLFLSEEGDSDRGLEAAYWAELESDLAGFRSGIREEIGESGVNLSGGQKQRVNLARAIYSGRKILIMDDPMSALDGRTESALIGKLTAPSAGGFLLVTHRMGEIARLEDVLVLEEGRIVERGSPADLMKNPDSHLSRVLRAYDEKESL